MIGSELVNGQQLVWEQILPAERIEIPDTLKKFRDEFSDKNYNLGSEKLPSPRREFSEHQDGEGNVWLFSGIGFDSKGNWGLLNDLWKYNPEKNYWELLFGSREISESGSVHGLAPTPRRSALTWIDAKGNFWLMGGRSFNDNEYFGDLWMFNVSNKIWIPVTNSSLNAPSKWGEIKNKSLTAGPGSRAGSSTWTDSEGNLWLFGGNANTYEGDMNFYNDVWQFNPQTFQWSWMMGADKANAKTSYIINKKEGLTPGPSPRSNAALWYEMESGRIWIYGGIGKDTTASHTGDLADLWSLDLKNELWTWESGHKYLFAQNSDRLDEKQKLIRISPGYRSNSRSWIGKDGNFYLAGGQNSYSIYDFNINPVVWIYSPRIKKWNVSVPANSDSITYEGLTFQDKEGNLIIFGGEKFNAKSRKKYPTNEMWKLLSK